MKIVAGIDVSKGTLDIRHKGKSLVASNDPSGFRRVAKFCQGADWVVMEATGSYHAALALYLHAKGFQVAVLNPARPAYYARSMGKRNKTDQVDAQTLVEFGQTHELEAFAPPTERELLLCRLVRLRADLVEQRAQVKGRMKDPAQTSFECEMLQKQYQFFKEQIGLVEKKITALIQAEPVFLQAYELLTGISGIGPVTAWTWMAEMRDIGRFESAKKVGAFIGLCPSLRHSGTSVNGPGKLSRQGNATLRKALYLAALAAIREDNLFQAFYIRLLQKGKPNKTAIVAVMHKLARVAYAVLKSGIPFKPERALTN